MKLNNPLVTVLIVNFNGYNMLDKCLTSLLNTNYPHFEIIFVDNGSSDDSVDFISNKFGKTKNLKILPLMKNYGFAQGNNIGAKYANGDYLVFLNNDTQVDPEWLSNLVKVMESDMKIGVAQAKLLRMDYETIDSAGAFVNKCGFVFNRGYGEKDIGQYDKIDNIFYAKGAAMIVRSILWKELDGFDPIFFFYSEERDFCWRTWLFDYKVVFVPSAKVYHMGGASVKSTSFLKYHEIKGRIITLTKNYELKNLLFYLPLSLSIGFFNLFRLILKRDLTSIISTIKGSFWCIRNFEQIWTCRKRQFLLRKKSDEFVKKHLMIKSLLPEYTIFARKILVSS